ncbi:hypothetical protein [Microlunatus sp. Y2014]|uniref:hypothetical protein n=1 Tax=Microlunatus sp. Y2014 TaxID=3418488 RepID=UPI003DA70D9C
MSGVLDPVGPEEPRTYWIRRGIVLAAVVALVVVIVVAVSALTGGAGGQAAAPPPTDSNAPSLEPENSEPPTPSASPETPAPSSSGATPSASSSETPSATTSPSGSATSPAATPSATSKAPTTSAPPPPPKACDPSQLRVTLTGPNQIKTGQQLSFEVGVINGSKTACTLEVNEGNYEFRVYSGTDRIWSTKDCAAWNPKIKQVLEPEADVSWTVDWGVKRSKAPCSTTKDVLRPGTYAANALLTGAEPVQLVMRLR